MSTNRLADVEVVALEAMIDSVGLSMVLAEIAAICEGKAEHVTANWQEQGLGRLWDECADRVDTAANCRAARRLRSFEGRPAPRTAGL
ncbi:MAG: hypothetical protein EHM24_09115 [Acidobacteria bacterium]|nr:MAG: hypothetical protein EHM24_09115 [Acidobacteriota bacterium]